MPAASNTIPIKREYPEGVPVPAASKANITLHQMLTDYSDPIDSWYRITVNRVLSKKEASKLKGYYSMGGVNSNSFFEITLWYDYIRQEKMDKKVIIRQLGTTEWQYDNERRYEVCESYVVLLARQFSNWDSTDTFLHMFSYQIIDEADKDCLVQSHETFPEFQHLQINNDRLNEAGFFVYDLISLVKEFQLIYPDIVAENDKYIMPSHEEFLNEYRYDKSPFAKDSNE